MLEQTARSPSWRHLARSATRGRTLHGVFWRHGAGDLELPAWNYTPMQPLFERHVPQLSPPSARNPSDPPLLDFLYPPAALAYMRRAPAARRRAQLGEAREMHTGHLTVDAAVDEDTPDVQTPLPAHARTSKDSKKQNARERWKHVPKKLDFAAEGVPAFMTDREMRDLWPGSKKPRPTPAPDWWAPENESTGQEHNGTYREDGMRLHDGPQELRNWAWAVEMALQNPTHTIGPNRAWEAWCALPKEHKNVARANQLLEILAASPKARQAARVLQMLRTRAYRNEVPIHTLLTYQLKAAMTLHYTGVIMSAYGHLLQYHFETKTPITTPFRENLMSWLLDREQKEALRTAWIWHTWYLRVSNYTSSRANLARIDFDKSLQPHLLRVRSYAVKIRRFLRFLWREVPNKKEPHLDHQLKHFLLHLIRLPFLYERTWSRKTATPEIALDLLRWAKRFGINTPQFYEKLINLSFDTMWTRRSRLKGSELLAYRKSIYKRYKGNTPNFQPSKGLLRSLLHNAVQERDEGYLHVLLADWRRHHGPFTVALSRIILSWHASRGEVQEVQSLFDKIRPRVGNMSWEILGSLLHVHAMRRDPAAVESRLEWIRAEFGLEPNHVAYTILMHAYFRVQDYNGVLSTFSKIVANNLSPSDRTFAILCALTASRGDVELTGRFWRMAQSHGIRTVVLDGLLIKAHVRRREFKEAEDLALVMQKHWGVKGHRNYGSRFWIPLIWALCNAHQPREAMRLVNRTGKYHERGDGLWQATRMLAFLTHRRFMTCEATFVNVLPSHGIKPTALHYSIMIEMFLRTRRFAKGFRTYAEFQATGQRPTLSLRVTMLRLVSKMSAQAQQQMARRHPDIRFDLPEQLLDEYLNDSDPRLDTVEKGPAHYAESGVQGDVEAQYIGVLLDLYRSQKAHGRVNELLARHEALVAQKSSTSGPMPAKIMHHLMMQRLRQGRHADVAAYFDQIKQRAMSLATTSRTRNSTLPAGSSLILKGPLQTYIKSLAYQGHYAQIVSVARELRDRGLDLDNDSLNTYVRALIRREQYTEGFDLAERHLYSSFPGWNWDQRNDWDRAWRGVAKKAYDFIKLPPRAFAPPPGTKVFQWPTLRALHLALWRVRHLAVRTPWAQAELQRIERVAPGCLKLLRGIPPKARESMAEDEGRVLADLPGGEAE